MTQHIREGGLIIRKEESTSLDPKKFGEVIDKVIADSRDPQFRRDMDKENLQKIAEFSDDRKILLHGIADGQYYQFTVGELRKAIEKRMAGDYQTRQKFYVPPEFDVLEEDVEQFIQDELKNVEKYKRRIFSSCGLDYDSISDEDPRIVWWLYPKELRKGDVVEHETLGEIKKRLMTMYDESDPLTAINNYEMHTRMGGMQIVHIGPHFNTRKFTKEQKEANRRLLQYAIGEANKNVGNKEELLQQIEGHSKQSDHVMLVWKDTGEGERKIGPMPIEEMKSLIHLSAGSDLFSCGMPVVKFTVDAEVTPTSTKLLKS